jgi:hypothetical protein
MCGEVVVVVGRFWHRQLGNSYALDVMAQPVRFFRDWRSAGRRAAGGVDPRHEMVLFPLFSPSRFCHHGAPELPLELLLKIAHHIRED